jgi:hypothetical protein
VRKTVRDAVAKSVRIRRSCDVRVTRPRAPDGVRVLDARLSFISLISPRSFRVPKNHRTTRLLPDVYAYVF